jgi:competence protein ComEA
MQLNLSREQQLILLGLIVSIVIGFGVMLYRNMAGVNGSDGIKIEEPKTGQIQNQTGMILAHISGAVGREGVYKLNYGDRLMDVLKMAGGPLFNADLSAINLSAQVKDGEKIIVAFKAVPIASAIEAKGAGMAGAAGAGPQKLNINTADEKALDALPGVGPSTAKAIVEYRRISGPFNRIEQIMEIPRFGKSKFERIKDKITL